MDQEYKYDYLILGTGMSALSAGALLANAGYKVCMLEAHDIPGGYAQSFKWGDYYFCGQVHYIWGCGPGGKINTFLKKLGLENDITFELYDTNGYDRVGLPDGKIVSIPNGFDELAENIEKAYPGQKANVQKFTKTLLDIRAELRRIPDRKIAWWEYVTKIWGFPNLIKYRNSTLQDIFDECKLSPEAQAVLAGNAGDFMLPPKELSIFPYAALFCGYNGGAYYPTKHYKYMIDRIAQSITSRRGCHIFYETLVTKINVEGDRVTSVETQDGRTFTARTIICNIDPKAAAKMIGYDKLPARYTRKLNYTYSGSSLMVYLALKDIDLVKSGLGRWNLWHLGQWDVNKIWDDQKKGDFSHPWFFMSTPTLHSQAPGTAPAGHQIVEIATYTEHVDWKALHDQDYKAYEAKKNALVEKLLDIIEARYIPNIRKHIVVKLPGSPTSNEEWAWAPMGNAYGQTMTPKEIGIRRFPMDTPFTNFYFCNATAGYASVYGTIGNGISLYAKLTGDNFYHLSDGPTDEQFAAQARAMSSAARLPDRAAPSVQGAFK